MKRMLQQLTFMVIVVVSLAGCKNGKDIPDVSGIDVPLVTERFETDLFAVDTLKLDVSLRALNAKHPGFTQDFLFNILGTSVDSVARDLPSFIRTYHGMYKASEPLFGNFDQTAAQVKRGLQFVHYYFPAYKLPGKIITFIGPVNSYGNIITANALAVGLQLYMGKDYPLYLSNEGQQMYPLFVSRRFEPVYIPVNCMKNIIDDMYPNASMGAPLVDQMVESGKRQYVLDKLLPETADTLKTGYTKAQLEGCYASETSIWSFFVQNNLLYNTDPDMTRDYMSDGPNTQALGKESPGNIGQFVGTQIVNKWMRKNKGLSLDSLMHTPPRKIFSEARYKP